MLGTYGDVTFEVSTELMRSWNSFQRSGKARWAAHELVQDKPVLQHVGPDLEEIRFTVRLDVSHGLNPQAECDKLRKMRDDAEPQPLTIGGKPLGKFVLENLEESHNTHDNRGNILTANVNLTLKEYHERGEEPKYRQGLTGVSSLADDAQQLPWLAADAAKGVTTVPDLVADQVTAKAGDAGGGLRSKISKAVSGIQQAFGLAQGGVQGLVSKGMDKLGLDLPSMSSLAGSNPAGAVSTVLDKASGLPIGESRQALSQTLGSDLAGVGEKYLGRASEFTDTARYANLGWLSGVNADRALGDVSVGRAASLTGKLAGTVEKLSTAGRINL